MTTDAPKSLNFIEEIIEEHNASERFGGRRRDLRDRVGCGKLSFMNLEQVRQRRSDIERLAVTRGAHNIRIFGSVARGDAGPDSDLDVLVEFEDDRSLMDLAGFELDLEDLLKCEVDVVTEGGLSPYLEDRILAEAVPL